ncbi:hypothetical protein BASA62_007664 [Batrachochytrium salamandrivorans]|nr:hypothetical protein BASA62_007664 [Batrachochytrium salamandrivorans]
MRVNVLVIAAMVVTSVNAGGKERPRGWFKQGDGSGLKSKSTIWIKSGASQDTDPTSKESSNGSDDDAAKKNQPASVLLPNYSIYSKEYLSSFDEFHIQLSISNNLKGQQGDLEN